MNGLSGSFLEVVFEILSLDLFVWCVIQYKEEQEKPSMAVCLVLFI